MEPNDMDLIEGRAKRVELSPAGCALSKRCRYMAAGWACVLRYRAHSRMISGCAYTRSFRRMALLAAVNGLKEIKGRCIVDLFTDERYLLEFGHHLLYRKRSHWFAATVNSGSAKNVDLWKEFRELGRVHRIRLVPAPGRPRRDDGVSADEAAFRERESMQDRDRASRQNSISPSAAA